MKKKAKKPSWSIHYSFDRSSEPASDSKNGVMEWLESPEGELYREISDTVCDVLEALQLDAHARYPHFPTGQIENQVIEWIAGEYIPEGSSGQPFDELDQLIECWINDHNRKRSRP